MLVCLYTFHYRFLIHGVDALFVLKLFIFIVADCLRPEQMWRLICLFLPHRTTNGMDSWLVLRVVKDEYKTKRCEEKDCLMLGS